MTDSWGADVPISMPSPPSVSNPSLIKLGDGFVMTSGGIFPDLNKDQFDEYVTPTFSPEIQGETSG